MENDLQHLIAQINKIPDGIRTKINKKESIKVFLRGLLRYPFSTFKTNKFAENMPNVFFGYSDHPLDRNATPFQYTQSFLGRNKRRKACCVLQVKLRNQYGRCFIFDGKGYDIFKVIDDEAEGIQHTYRVDEATPHQSITLQVNFLRSDVYRVRLALEEEVPENATPMVVGDLQENEFLLELSEFPDHYQIRTNKLHLAIYKQNFRIEVYNAAGELVTESGSKTKNEFSNAFDSYPLGFIFDGQTRTNFGVENFTLYPGEAIFGLGERFDGVNKMGKTIGHWSFEGYGNTSGRTYKPIPFFMSTQGYGIFLNESKPITHWIGTRETCTHQIAIQQDFIDYFFFYGPDFQHILNSYTDLTGKPKMVPKWSFGVWMSRWSYYSQEQVMQVAQILRKAEIPCDVIHIDAGWFEDEWACDWTFSSERFPDPEEMFSKLKQMGFRVSLWQIPYVLEQTHQFKDAKQKKVLAKRSGPFVWLFMFPGSPIDFSNKEGVVWYKQRLKKLLAMGADVIKVDFGEQIEPHLTFQAGDGCSMHNLYPLLYNQVAFEAVQESKGEAIIWARSAYAGSQRYPVHWSGDNSANFANMQTSLCSGLSLGLCGFSFWSQDTGGFGGICTDELYIRWTQLSVFQSHFRYHAPLPKYNEPWNYKAETQKIVKDFLNLRYRLIPYIFSESKVAVEKGLPLLRHLVIDFQNDPTVYHIEDQFMCGRYLLVAPLLTQNNSRKVYLPEGLWYDFWDGQSIMGKRWITISAPLDKIPVFIRSGTILPLGPAVQHTTEITQQFFSLNIYPGINGDAAYQQFGEDIEYAHHFWMDQEKATILTDLAPSQITAELYGQFRGHKVKVIHRNRDEI